jgi:hypothetical protein
MSQHAALNAGREEGAASSPSPRGTGRGRGFEDFLPPREKLSFLWRTMGGYRKCQSRGEYGLVVTLVLSCVGVPKKFQSKHKRHTCKLLRPPSGLQLTTPLPQLRGAVFLSTSTSDCARGSLELLYPILSDQPSFSFPHRHPGGCFRTYGG